EALVATGGTVAFDAIGGGKLAGQILTAMEIAANRTAKEYSRYGSTTHKQVYIYGGLDRGSTEFNRTFGMAWGMGGWLLTPFLQKIGLEAGQKLRERCPVEIKSAFGGWIDAGQAATGALRHLVRDLSAARLAWIDPEQFFVLTQERPEVRLKADGERTIQWPRSEFFAWQPGDGRDGLLLFSGVEPHQKWRTYTTAFLDVAERCGVKRIVSIGALLAGAPHTRPVRVTGHFTEHDWRALLEALGIYRRQI